MRELVKLDAQGDGIELGSRPLHYKVYAGNSLILCKGRLLSGPELGGFSFSFIMVTIAYSMFHAVSSPYLWNEVSPLLPICGAYLMILTLVGLVRTTFTDPGIIPRTSPLEGEWTIDREEGSSAPRTRDVFIGTFPYSLKYCSTCCIYRPPRAVHCSTCDACVDGFDHHCPWVSNCVGKRNYKFFLIFVGSVAIGCIFLFGSSLAHIILLHNSMGKSFWATVGEIPTALAVMIMTFFSFFSIGGLCFFHLGLLSDGLTTNEYIKRMYRSKRENPFHQGSMCSNAADHCCGPRRQSLLRLREPYIDPHFTDIASSDDEM